MEAEENPSRLPGRERQPLHGAASPGAGFIADQESLPNGLLQHFREHPSVFGYVSIDLYSKDPEDSLTGHSGSALNLGPSWCLRYASPGLVYNPLPDEPPFLKRFDLARASSPSAVAISAPSGGNAGW